MLDTPLSWYYSKAVPLKLLVVTLTVDNLVVPLEMMALMLDLMVLLELLALSGGRPGGNGR